VIQFTDSAIFCDNIARHTTKYWSRP